MKFIGRDRSSIAKAVVVVAVAVTRNPLLASVDEATLKDAETALSTSGGLIFLEDLFWTVLK